MRGRIKNYAHKLSFLGIQGTNAPWGIDPVSERHFQYEHRCGRVEKRDAKLGVAREQTGSKDLARATEPVVGYDTTELSRSALLLRVVNAITTTPDE